MTATLANVDVQLGNATTVVIQSGGASQIAILKATAFNGGNTSIGVSVWRVPNNGSPAESNQLISALASTIGAGETVVLPLSGQTLIAGQTLAASASNAAVTVSVGYLGNPL
jgi:hypothetical protein